MNIEIIDSYTEFCTAAHKELATIARANMGHARGGDAFWENIADASSTGILLSMCEAVRLPDVDEWPGVPQIDYQPLPEIENRIGRDILNRPGPFQFERNPAIAERLANAGNPVNFPISPAGLENIRMRVAEFIQLALWRFFSEQQPLAAQWGTL